MANDEATNRGTQSMAEAIEHCSSFCAIRLKLTRAMGNRSNHRGEQADAGRRSGISQTLPGWILGAHSCLTHFHSPAGQLSVLIATFFLEQPQSLQATFSIPVSPA